MIKAYDSSSLDGLVFRASATLKMTFIEGRSICEVISRRCQYFAVIPAASAASSWVSLRLARYFLIFLTRICLIPRLFVMSVLSYYIPLRNTQAGVCSNFGSMPNVGNAVLD